MKPLIGLLTCILLGWGMTKCDNSVVTTMDAEVISVHNQDVVGRDVETTVVFVNGQVESFYKYIGDPGDWVTIYVRMSPDSVIYTPLEYRPILNYSKSHVERN